MRFANGQPLPEAIELREALKERGVHLKIVELTAGADINHEVFESIEHAEAFMVFGTSNYGEKTSNPACTYFESEYARNAGKKMILLRMIPWEQTFDHLQARVMFGMNSLQLGWMEEAPMPGDLVEWCFYSPKGTHAGKRQKTGPRRIGITVASASSPKVIGRALSFAKSGESLDILLKQ